MAYRRLTGPTLICLAIAGLVADHLYLSDSRWSILAFISRFVSVFVKIFGPALNPALYGWLDRFLVPVSLLACVFVLLWLIVTRAKRAMRQASRNVDGVVPLSWNAIPLSQSTEAAQPSLPATHPRKYLLAWKLVISFGTLALIFTALVGIGVHTGLARALEKEIKHRAGLSAMVLTQIAEWGDSRYTTAELQRAIENQVSSRSIAYIYVEDATGQIIAHMPPELPRFLGSELRRTAERDIAGVETRYRGLPIFKIVERVPSPRAGYVHVAIWPQVIEEQVRQALLPIVASMLVLVCAACAAFARIVWYFTFPFSELARYANRLSQGELDLDLPIAEKSDEIRDLARSFSRMRSSLYAVLIRLKDAPQANQSKQIR